MGEEPVRRSPFAGTWYPAEPDDLRALVSRQLADASPSAVLPFSRRLVALISPHAGLVYSGPIAAAGYRLLAREASAGGTDSMESDEGKGFDTVVLLGPSHRVFFEGLALYPRGSFATPLGLSEVDAELTDAIGAETPRARAMPDVHRPEHCLEMQLPFLQLLLPAARIVPVIMGDQGGETIEAASRAIAAAVARSARRVLLIASSDLSHYQSRPRARELDAEVVGCVERFDPEGLERLLASGHGHAHACGGGPMVAILRAARDLGATESRVLRYGDSGEASGDTDSVVGYLSAALYGGA
jgi:MEMO1 family protein